METHDNSSPSLPGSLTTDVKKVKLWIISETSSPLPISVMVGDKAAVINPGQVGQMEAGPQDVMVIRTIPSLDPQSNPAIEV